MRENRPDGRYSKVFATEATVDDWDVITSVESPNAIASEPPKRRKRSGDWIKAELASAHRLAKEDP